MLQPGIYKIVQAHSLLVLKKKKGKRTNLNVSANFTVGFYFEFNTIFSTTTILNQWAKWFTYHNVRNKKN